MLIHKYTVLIAPLWIDGKMIFCVYKWWDEVEPHSGTHSSDRMREKWWRCFSGGWVLRVSRVWNPELLSGHLTYWGARGRGTRILKKSKQIFLQKCHFILPIFFSVLWLCTLYIMVMGNRSLLQHWLIILLTKLHILITQQHGDLNTLQNNLYWWICLSNLVAYRIKYHTSDQQISILNTTWKCFYL